MNIQLINALEQLQEDRGISKEEVIDALEKSLKVAYKKSFGEEENVEVKIDQRNGEITVFRIFEVVKELSEVTDINKIHVDEARKIEHLIVPGDMLRQKVNVKKFNRIAAQTAKQVLIQKIRELEKESLFTQYKDMNGKIVTAEIMRETRDGYEIRVGKLDTTISFDHLLPNDRFKNGDLVKVLVESIDRRNRGAAIKVDRVSAQFVQQLLSLEVPELENGIMQIKAIAREAGIRTKIALVSEHPQVDPIGASIGESGGRIAPVVRELKGEKIDVFYWSDDVKELIKNALAPAEVLEVEIVDPDNRISRVWVPPTQLSLAIGKGGQNARLAAKLTGWKVDIKPLLE
ncbi:MAG TPA: transcription termination factor NusA [Thermotogota bacterium]|nr:transcription termination/antitermination protein NusA [Thermotogota bacterium]NLZ12558.1 transcription termination/antitermination protein NusA [Thermotogaceae bacterium]MDD8041345.1 transcription termination factor NusA [Thermotogota bacterium]HNR63545.1 transcription termination factor NusA [Thermotogota bacterium]HNT95668.1 transcription termination factor NusA [Thermotogota bacterium]